MDPSTLVLETWELINVRPKIRTVAVRKQELKLMHVSKTPSKAQQEMTRDKLAKKI